MKIDKNVPFPENRSYGKWRKIAREWQIGDSILVNDAYEANGLRIAAAKSGQKCTQHKDDKGLRVWRIK